MAEPRQMDHCGYIAVVGRPNVGKSTLVNHLLGQKVSITSHKPQTTRHRILGIKTTDRCQIIYVDTPGIHRSAKRAINRSMNRAALHAMEDVDVILLVLEAEGLRDEDHDILGRLEGSAKPVVVAINKIDLLASKDLLLPLLDTLQKRYGFRSLVPISARRGSNVKHLEDELRGLLPPGTAYYPEDQVTDRSERFIAAELVREKLMRRLGQELPYELTVEIEKFTESEKGLLHIAALIWVERDAQKAIVIGRQGRLLKEIGQIARQDMERMFGKKIYLQLWVKVKEQWSDNEQALRGLGYVD